MDRKKISEPDLNADVIGPFSGPYRFLSNFYPTPISYEGVTWRTVEHAFQAAKTQDPLERAKIQGVNLPGDAKRIGRKVKLRPDWEDVKLDVMLALLRIKFADPELRAKLVATGDAELVEFNHWGDQFWGVTNEGGQNYLGKTLMAVREEITQSEPEPDHEPAGGVYG